MPWTPKVGKLIVRTILTPDAGPTVNLLYRDDPEEDRLYQYLAEMDSFITLPAIHRCHSIASCGVDEHGTVVYERAATDRDLIGFVRLWDDDSRLPIHTWLQQVLDLPTLEGAEKKRLARIISGYARPTANKQGTTVHPDLPACVKCESDKFDNRGYTVSILGTVIHYICSNCGTRVIYRGLSKRGVIVWVEAPIRDEMWDAQNQLGVEIQKYLKGDRPDLPPVPPGLQAHLCCNDTWTPLPNASM
jgi:hypothetical protein